MYNNVYAELKGPCQRFRYIDASHFVFVYLLMHRGTDKRYINWRKMFGYSHRNRAQLHNELDDILRMPVCVCN